MNAYLKEFYDLGKSKNGNIFFIKPKKHNFMFKYT